MKYKILGKQYNTDKCFVCGMSNDAGVKAQFYTAQRCNDDNVPSPYSCLITVIKPQAIHQSYPNRMHGGVISALLDESIGRAVQITHPDIWAVTIDLNVKFRSAVPLDQTLYIESKITNVGTRAFEGEAEMYVGRQSKSSTSTSQPRPVATATGKFFIVPYDTAFPTEKLTDKNWFMVPENFPKYIEI
ncbi:MAG: PaaI family thioesterase [Christensenellaceae bacterium]|jgi:acyl-coenzyme A thioesterase PaaI-like protein|nr:PaaI family thioesterase [Christensenellaceae bacterium]